MGLAVRTHIYDFEILFCGGQVWVFDMNWVKRDDFQKLKMNKLKFFNFNLNYKYVYSFDKNYGDYLKFDEY
jgi:hypothetical protein